MKTLYSLLLGIQLIAAGAVHAQDDVYRRVLLPLNIVVEGAYESHFATDLAIHNRGTEEIAVLGLDQECQLSGCIDPDPLREFIQAGRTVTDWQHSGTPGQFIDIPASATVDFSLRARDFSRVLSSLGTEVPVVPLSEFPADGVNLLNVRSDGEFRSMLRVYAQSAITVSVRIIRQFDNFLLDETTLALPSPMHEYSPAYAELSPIPLVGISSVRVEIIPHAAEPVWAFISMTNNVTQEITLVTPQR